LVDHALRFGWPRERVQVIDEDFGYSGATSDGRSGFQRLIAEIGLGHAGLVLSLDASARRATTLTGTSSSSCGLFGVLIADGERLFDPAPLLIFITLWDFAFRTAVNVNRVQTSSSTRNIRAMTLGPTMLLEIGGARY